MTSLEFDRYLEKYADVAIRVGLNFQEGQRLIVRSPITEWTVPLARKLAVSAYRAGARYVDVMWSDEQLDALRLKYAPADSFEEFSHWRVNGVLEFAERDDAILSISASDPDLLAGYDPESIATIRKTAAKHGKPISDYTAGGKVNWLIVGASFQAWADKVFPDLPAEARTARLWDAIFDICRIKQADPVAAWQAHLEKLAARREYLNTRRYSALKLTAPGTDLTLGLPDAHLWLGGSITTECGLPFTPNIPTEEVFTLPHAARTEGTVTATKPLNLSGTLIEDFSLTFSGGRVVGIRAKSGQEHLEKLIATDDNAARLGEIALVPHSSPISQSGLLFYNTLFDENASCHIALGRAYRASLNGGVAMTDEAFAAGGGNISLIHTDFMIGSAEMDIDGIRPDGTTEPVMRAGEWVIAV
jgi:aminopeptidase